MSVSYFDQCSMIALNINMQENQGKQIKTLCFLCYACESKILLKLKVL